MKIESDQSIKIENTSKDTVLAFSNKESFAICIKAKTKRQLQEKFRKIGEPRSFVLRVFSAGVALLLKNYSDKQLEVIIDIEYPGHEKTIKDLILQMYGKISSKKIENITFGLIGKNSRAHIVTYNIKIKKRNIEKIITCQEIEKIAILKLNNKKRVMKT